MQFTSKSLYFFTIIALSTCQYYDSYQKFRPSPVDNPHDYTITHYSPNDYIMSYKPPTAPYPSHVQPPSHHYGYPPARPQYYPEVGQQPPLYHPQPPQQLGGQFGPGKPLFTPADSASAAATLGQIDNFNKALREEAEENQKNQQSGFLNGIGLPGSSGFGKSYVDVKFGGPNNLRYQYTL